jgi:hypothetical protein
LRSGFLGTELPASRGQEGLILDASAFEFILSQIPPFD